MFNDILKRNFNTLNDVVRGEAFKDIGLPITRHTEHMNLRAIYERLRFRIRRLQILRGGGPHFCLIPEEVFPTIREVVRVRIRERQVHTRIGFWRPREDGGTARLEIIAVRLCPLIIGVGKAVRTCPRATFRRLKFPLIECRLISIFFRFAEVRLTLIRILRIVQAFVETTQLSKGGELTRVHIARRIIIGTQSPLRINGRQIIALNPVRSERGNIAGSVRECLARLPCTDGVDIWNAVLVDIAKVILCTIFLREDRLVLRFDIARIIFRHLCRERNRSCRNALPRFRRNHRRSVLIIATTFRVYLYRQPAIEERVVSRVGISVIACCARADTSRGTDSPVHSVAQRTIIDIAHLIAKRIRFPRGS